MITQPPIIRSSNVPTVEEKKSAKGFQRLREGWKLLRGRIRITLKGKRCKGRGRVYNTSTGWTEEQIQGIIHLVCKRYPGITSINVYKNEINWNSECSLNEFLGKKEKKRKDIPNPSKRPDHTLQSDIDHAKCANP